MKNLLGIYEKALPELSWDERYAMASEAGYDFIELSIDKNRLNKLDYSDEDIAEINDMSNSQLLLRINERMAYEEEE